MKVGDKVEWQARYQSDPKNVGHIVAVIPAGVRIREILPELKDRPLGSGNLPRKEESYVVEVVGALGGKRRFWPFTKNLTKA